MITDLSSSVKHPQLIFVLNNITLLTQSFSDNKIDFETYVNLVCDFSIINMKHSDRVELVLINDIFNYVFERIDEKTRAERQKTQSTTDRIIIDQKLTQLRNELTNKRDNFRLKFALSRLKIVESAIREYSVKLLWNEILNYLEKYVDREELEDFLRVTRAKIGGENE